MDEEKGGFKRKSKVREISNLERREPMDSSTESVLLDLRKRYSSAFEKGVEYRKNERERWGKHSVKDKFNKI